MLDASVVYASLDDREPEHGACRALITGWSGPLIIPILTIAEFTKHLGRWIHPLAEAAIVGDLDVGVVVDAVPVEEWARIADLVERYADLPLGTVDASIVACAERLRVTAIATLNRRDFSVVKPAHVDAFELLP